MSRTKASILLILVFMARGTSFLASKTLMQSMSPMSVLAVRFLAAFLILALVFRKKLRECDRRSLRGGVILGIMYTVCMCFEMFGLRTIDTGVSSLIENMAIVLVPLYAAALTRTAPRKKTMFCAALAVTGVGFLSLAQSRVGGGWGIVLAVLAAMTYAGCILVTETVSRDAEPVTVGIVQMGTMAVLSLIAGLIEGSLSVPQGGNQWLMMGVLVLVCSCFGFAFQPLGQKYLPAETAAVFTVVNPLTASVLGIAVAGERLTAAKLTGYVLILLSLLLYNLRTGEAQSVAGNRKAPQSGH